MTQWKRNKEKGNRAYQRKKKKRAKKKAQSLDVRLGKFISSWSWLGKYDEGLGRWRTKGVEWKVWEEVVMGFFKIGNRDSARALGFKVSHSGQSEIVAHLSQVQKCSCKCVLSAQRYRSCARTLIHPLKFGHFYWNWTWTYLIHTTMLMKLTLDSRDAILGSIHHAYHPSKEREILNIHSFVST